MRGQVWTAALIAALGVLPAAAQGLPGTITLAVQANPVKWNNQPWDGAETMAPIVLPTTTPPDLGVCVVSPRGGERCVETQRQGRRQSLCQNSLECVFEAIPVDLREPFGVFVYDIDVARDDLVDILIIEPAAGTPPARTAGLEAQLRSMMDARTPAVLPLERDRRARAIPVLTQEQCRAGCQLVQSRLWLR